MNQETNTNCIDNANGNGIIATDDNNKSNSNDFQVQFLGPTLIDSDHFKGYKKALDESFCNNEVKNIAITGIYGSGKSSVWNTYVKVKNEESIDTIKQIVVSVCDFHSEVEKKSNESDMIHSSIEREIINQIICQVKPKSIPHCNYQLKTNNSFREKIYRYSFFLSIGYVVWWSIGFRNMAVSELNWKIPSIVEYAILWFAWMYILIYSIEILSEFNIQRLDLKVSNIEAKIDCGDDNESILERDNKELIYIIANSGANVVVFEDLDRYEDTTIFNKLRRLNIKLNLYLDSTGKSERIRFVYLIKNGLFDAQSRLKFFDVLIPVIPVLDAYNSEKFIEDLTNKLQHQIDKKAVIKVSLYIDDMRLLKNIVNEYSIYSDIVSDEEKDIEFNTKLFCMILYKNLLPEDFDKFEKNQGYVFNIFNKLEDARSRKVKQIEKDIAIYRNKIGLFKKWDDLSRYEKLFAYIPAEDINNNPQILDWPSFLEKELTNIHTNGDYIVAGSKKYRHDIRFYLMDELKLDRYGFAEFDSDQYDNATKKIEQLEKDLVFLQNANYSDMLNKSNLIRSEEIFDCDNVSSSHKLINTLIEDGYLDEFYPIYRGNKENQYLTSRDRKFLIACYDGDRLKESYALDNPNKVNSYLGLKDFIRMKSMNRNLMRYCLKNDSEKILELLKSNVSEDLKSSLVDTLEIIFEDDEQRELVKTLYDKNIELLQLLLLSDYLNHDRCIKILIYLYTNLSIDENKLSKLNDCVENEVDIFKHIGEHSEECIRKLKLAEVKFKHIDHPSKDIPERLYKEGLCEINPNNIHCLIWNRDIDCNFSAILTQLEKDDRLSDLKESVDNNYEFFIKEYIDSDSKQALGFTNEEDAMIKVINSDIPYDYKKRFLLNSLNKIENVDQIKNQGEYNQMLEEIQEFEKLRLQGK